jgi:TniQ
MPKTGPVFNSLKLLKTPTPQSDENLMGYIVRLTEENVYLSPSWIFDLAGLKANTREGGWPTLYRDIMDFSGLEPVTGLERQQIKKLRSQIADTDDSLYIRGTPINFIRYSLPKVCPACLKQYGYCQYIWDLLPVTACPVHKAILIDKCTRCQRCI